METGAAEAPVARRRIKVKRRIVAPPAAATVTEDGGLKPAVRRAILAPHKAQTAGQDGGIEIATTLAPRHYDWLMRASRKEGRTPAQMLERLVRIACSQDPTKGYAPAELGSGVAVPSGGVGSQGVTGTHPASGTE